LTFVASRVLLIWPIFDLGFICLPPWQAIILLMFMTYGLMLDYVTNEQFEKMICATTKGVGGGLMIIDEDPDGEAHVLAMGFKDVDELAPTTIHMLLLITWTRADNSVRVQSLTIYINRVLGIMVELRVLFWEKIHVSEKKTGFGD
ncbi:hypothetical protein ACJX0J_037161, partial [Zea mays]